MKTYLAIGLAVAAGLAVFGSVQATQWGALPEQAPAPADNPTMPAKVELGKMLYKDPRFFHRHGLLPLLSQHLGRRQ